MVSRLLVFVLVLAAICAAAEDVPGVIEGMMVLKETGDPVHAGTVHILELDRSALSDHDGRLRFDRVPPGTYHLAAHAEVGLTEASEVVTVRPGQTATVRFLLSLATVRQQVTVTASGEAENTFESFQSVYTQSSFDLAQQIAPSLGETLAGKPGNGIAKRSFGPGTERPIIRGFDGDRVLIMQDGLPTGTLSSQSGDHGELTNTGGLDRLEVVKGPATLLYGGNAVGGVVNALTRHHSFHEHSHQGVRGYLSGSAGTANGFASGSGGFEVGHKNWMFWGSGGGQSSGDYSTPEGKVPNSATKLWNGGAGMGWYGARAYLSGGAEYNEGVYGVPFAAEFHEQTEQEHPGDEGRVELEGAREGYQLNWGLRGLGKTIENFISRVNYTRWRHSEVDVSPEGARTTGTRFDNKQLVFRGMFEQAKKGSLTGRFGFSGLVRDYLAEGEEALAPPVDQGSVAGFALEELDFEKVKLQFGGRVEHTTYEPGARTVPATDQPPGARSRSFTGASAAAGINVGLWRGGAFVGNYTRSYRPPALEELYNNGPHVGNLAWEIGDENLDAESGNGIDLSLRQHSSRARAELNFFHYSFDNFVFPFFTGQHREGLRVMRFDQTDSRFVGAESNVDVGLHRNLWLNLGLDYVNALEKTSDSPLPRIPPLRGRAGFEFLWNGLSVRPEVILADRQDRLFSGETETAGYALFGIQASYTVTQGHLMHQFAVNTFNLGDRLYRNHSSFIKDLAPEIGRGIRFTYRVRFF